jgi:serine protease Do
VRRAGGVLAVVAAVAACRERLASPSEAAAGAAPRAAVEPVAPGGPAPRVLYPSGPRSFVDLVGAARGGVVAIRAGAPVKTGPAAMFPGAPETSADVALGTGFLIEARGVYVLTNDHIAAASTDLRVVLSDRRDVPARLVGRDVRLDLALLSIDVPRLAPLPLGDSDDLQVGEWLVVLGDPFGDEVTASAGIVSATGREVAGSLIPARAMGFRTFLQTDARVHRGNSGGPVLDVAGQVVGVAVATGDRPGEVSFAIPINRVKEVLDALREVGQVSRSWLGVLVQPVDAAVAKTAGLAAPTGALITEVKAGSPAARADLRVGDIIVAWGEHAIDHRTLPWVVAQTPVGRTTTAAVWRNRTRLAIAIVPEKMPE